MIFNHLTEFRDFGPVCLIINVNHKISGMRQYTLANLFFVIINTLCFGAYTFAFIVSVNRLNR